ncbi:MAG: hypothetical protein IPJ86_12485 [Bacteroidetes bacterium]|nr:hypothetical protein [Bacteroidota bacterium]
MRKLLLLLLIPLWSSGQPSQNKEITKSVTLPDGVYLSFQQLKDGKPGIPPAQLQIRTEKTVSVKQWFKTDSLFYINNFGKKNTISPDSVFAFADDGDVYIQRKGIGHKFTIVGSLCYFTESYPVKNAPLSPVTIDHAKDVIPRMMDFETGEFHAYSISSMEEFLKGHDNELYDEYMAIDNLKHKRQLLIRYIEKYNERHPLTTNTRL